MIWCDPGAVGLYVTEQELEFDPPIGTSGHVAAENVPEPAVMVQVTVPMGALLSDPPPLSVTVAVHVVEPPKVTVDGLHATEVVVGRGGLGAFTVTSSVPLLVAYLVSPG